MTHVIYILWAFCVGALMPVQAGINSSLGREVGSPIFAAFVSFTGGTLLLAMLLSATRAPVPSWQQIAQLPPWMLIGGFLGANMVTAAIWVSPRISILTFLLIALAGQLLVASLLDHFGLLGYPRVPMNFWRALGVALVIVGALLTRIR